MRILQVIHGYPMRFNAGSEVYTQGLCHRLADQHEVRVFTREENTFVPAHTMREERDRDDPRVGLHIVNVPNCRDRYRSEDIDLRFRELLETWHPDVIHVQHLNHLSTSLVDEAARRGVPVVFTLHDFWLICPRGQFIQNAPADPRDPWALCGGQEHEKCARRCYSRFFSGAPAEQAADAAAWTDWVRRRMEHVRAICKHVDTFVAPSRYLLERFRRDFGMAAAKLAYLDYGFDRERLHGRQRRPGEPFTFGYIGTHIPAKGVHVLLDAFGRLRGSARLRIWGRPRSPETDALRALAAALPSNAAARVEWLPEYRNQDIVCDVFDRIDAIVVPSIWVENSPLVIHEAQGAQVPVITADAGGMAELVQHEVNGLLFRHRDPAALAAQMQRLSDDRDLAVRLGSRGYLAHPEGLVPELRDHVRAVESLYADAIGRRRSARVEVLPGPWRITLDTNPDDCNLHCVMCEDHSPHSTTQATRKAAGRPPRRMPIELVRRVVAEAAALGLRELIPSTMGEPLLFAEFEEILALCRKHGVKLNLTTNGTFPRLGARTWAERIVPLASDVKISWNGATKETHEAVMLGVRWEQAIENVRAFIAVRDGHAAAGGNRCRVTFQVTFLETNVAELPDIVRLAAELGVDRVKGHHLWAHFKEIERLSMRRNPDAIARWNSTVRAAIAVAATCPLPDGRHVLLENVFPLGPGASADLAPGGACPFLGQEAWISAEGRFNTCCAPDAQRRTLGDFGTLHEHGLREIWEGRRYRDLVATYMTRDLCRGCNMRRPATP